MNHIPETPCPPSSGNRRRSWLKWLVLTGCALLLLLVLLRPRPDTAPPAQWKATQPALRSTNGSGPAALGRTRPPQIVSSTPSGTAAEIVGRKLAQFARSRREHTHALARKHNVTVPDSVEQFFAAVESGNWEEIDRTFNVINGGDSSASQNSARPPELTHLWPAIIDAFGVAEQVHEWPPQQLLDYGNAVLNSLRPGMVYVGGTDNGRWIPELLNDTSDGERHIILTQNGLADNTYADYLNLQYGERFATFSEEDSARIFKEYSADAVSRLRHDQEHPDEPKQLRHGEDVRVSDGPLESGLTDGRVQISGQIAVMSINEKLLQLLMEKNPDLSFAVQESFPLKGTYTDALPLGPLMELKAQSGDNPFTQERAAQSLEYWRSATEEIMADTATMSSESALKSYSHDSVAAANLLAEHKFTKEAEEAYRLGSKLWPGNPEPINYLVDMLTQDGRGAEARQMAEDFARRFPEQAKDLKDKVTFRVEGPAP